MPRKKPRVESEYFLNVNSIYIDEKSTFDDEWISKELDEYIKAPRNSNILEWWRKHETIYPTLANTEKDVLSTLATSVPIEWFFP